MSITPFPSQGQYPWYDQLEQWGADVQTVAENATIAAGPLVEITPPEEFVLSAPVPHKVYRDASGKYLLDMDVDAMRPPAGVTYYIAPNGSSANTGLSAGSPIRLADAINKPDVGTIICAPGEYFRNTHTAPTIRKNLTVKGAAGAILTGFEQPSELTWTLESGSIYKTPRSSLQSVFDTRAEYRDANGNAVRYKRVSELSALTGPGQMAHDGESIFVWALGDANLAADSSFLRVSVEAPATVLRVEGPYTLVVENLQVHGGGSLLTGAGSINAASSSEGRPTLIVLDCDVRYSPSRGIKMDGSAFSLIARTSVQVTGMDSVTYTSTTVGGVNGGGQGIEVDVSTLSTGLIDPSQTGNGTTAHGRSKVLRINGIYRDSNGPAVDEDGGAMSWNLACAAGTTRPSTRFWAYCASSANAKMWLEDCSADPARVALYAYDETSTIYLRRPRTGSLMGMSKVAGPGTIATY